MTRTPCPTPHKTAYLSRRDARSGAKWQVVQANKQGIIMPTLYRYPCSCGRWHTTKMEALPGQPSNEIAVDVPRELQEWAIHG